MHDLPVACLQSAAAPWACCAQRLHLSPACCRPPARPCRCEVAGLLRSISMRRAHHAALRSADGLLPRLRALLAPGALGWVDLKASAKKILQAGCGKAIACRGFTP